MWLFWLLLGLLAALVGGIAGLLRSACERVEEWATGIAFVAAMAVSAGRNSASKSGRSAWRFWRR